MGENEHAVGRGPAAKLGEDDRLTAAGGDDRERGPSWKAPQMAAMLRLERGYA